MRNIQEEEEEDSNKMENSGKADKDGNVIKELSCVLKDN